MKAVVWHGRRDIRVDSVPDPRLEEPNDIIIEVTSSGICGSDLHLYEVLTMYMEPGDILGHEPMGRAELVDGHTGACAADDVAGLAEASVVASSCDRARCRVIGIVIGYVARWRRD